MWWPNKFAQIIFCGSNQNVKLFKIFLNKKHVSLSYYWLNFAKYAFHTQKINKFFLSTKSTWYSFDMKWCHMRLLCKNENTSTTEQLKCALDCISIRSSVFYQNNMSNNLSTELSSMALEWANYYDRIVKQMCVSSSFWWVITYSLLVIKRAKNKKRK